MTESSLGSSRSPTKATTTATTIMMTTTNTDTTRKRPPPLFLPNGVTLNSHKKQRRGGLVRRTHSPKTVPSPLSTPVGGTRQSPTTNSTSSNTNTNNTHVHPDVRRIAPTVKGVAEAARVMNTGHVLALPTETVYMLCTTLFLQENHDNNDDEACTNASWNRLCEFSSCQPSQQQSHTMLIVQSALDVDWMWSTPPKPYALKSAHGNGLSHKPILLQEGREVLCKLALRYWPGPMTIYIRTDSNRLFPGLYHTLPSSSSGSLESTTNKNDNTKDAACYVGLTCPSHPLTGRVGMEVRGQGCLQHSNDKDPVVIVASLTSFTKATDLCQHYLTVSKRKNPNPLHVLNGEDKRELFTVPTCQYGKPCPTSLWIDDMTRTIHIWGEKDHVLHVSESLVKKALGMPMATPSSTTATATSTATTSPGNKDDETRNRVILGVLRTWKVLDHRL